MGSPFSFTKTRMQCGRLLNLIHEFLATEVFRWNTGEWTPCSHHCGEGVRKWRVKCLQYVEHVLSLPAVVDDSECLAATMVLLLFLSFTFFHQFNYLSMT
jgi:hypothetical protein